MKMYVVKCEVDMRRDSIREVVVISHRCSNAIRRAINQLKGDGHFNVCPISCREMK